MSDLDTAYADSRLAAEYLSLAAQAVRVTRHHVGLRKATKFEKKSSADLSNDLARSQINLGIAFARRALTALR